jgi:hypothetical protein
MPQTHRGSSKLGTSEISEQALVAKPTMDMLCVAPWTSVSDVDEVKRWRHAVNPTFVPKAKENGRYSDRPYPDFWNKQVLVDAFLKKELQDQRNQRTEQYEPEELYDLDDY